MRIEYNLTAQETDYFCVPAIFQAILRRRKHEISQTEIARKLETTEKKGTKINSAFFTFFYNYGLQNKYMEAHQVPMQNPTSLIEYWLMCKGDLYFLFENKMSKLGHANLVVGLENSEVIAMDPEDLTTERDKIENIYSYIARTKIGGFGIITQR